MSLKHADPGGSATGGTQQVASPTTRFTAQTSVTNGQAYAYLLDTGSPAALQSGKSAVGLLQAAGNRVSVFTRFPALPSDNTSLRLLGITPTGVNTTLLSVAIGSDGKLRLYTNGIVTILGAAGSTVLGTNTWYRIGLSYAITTTTNWSAKVYINGVLEMTRTNTDGTLSSAAPTDILHGLNTGAGTSFLAYLSDIYADDTTDQSDPGNVHVTAKQPTTTTTNDFDTTVGTGAVNERPVSVTNGKTHAATTDVDQDYEIQAAAAGDVDLTSATVVGYVGWVWSALSSATSTPTSKLILAGARTAQVVDPAGTAAVLTTTVVTSSSYPQHANGKNIGLSSTTIAADAQLADCGVIVVYIPSSTRSVAGDQPSPTGALTRVGQRPRALAGSQPTATGTLSRLKQAPRALNGAQPAPTGTLVRLLAAPRALAGNQPAPTGSLTRLLQTIRALAGDQPFSTGVLTRREQAVRELAGDQGAATGDLTRNIVVTRSVAGDQPAPTGTLDRLKAASRSLAGDLPSATGALLRSQGWVRALAGNQPAASGTIDTFKAVSSVNVAGDQPAASGDLIRLREAVRSAVGDQPAPTGVLSRLAIITRSLAGDQPAPTGVLTRLRARAQALAGNQPVPTGSLLRVLATFRSLAGNLPALSGTLAGNKTFARALAGSLPTATGVLTRLKAALRSLTGDQPAPTGSLTRLKAALRALAGDVPVPDGLLTRNIAVTRVLAGVQPAASAVLAGARSSIRTVLGDQPAPTGVLVALWAASQATYRLLSASYRAHADPLRPGRLYRRGPTHRRST